MTAASFTATLPFPPSTNTYWRHLTKGPLAGRTLISEAGRNYRQALVSQAFADRWPKFGDGARLAVLIVASMPDKRRRDLDNVLKATLDSITHAGLWGDDSQIDELCIVRDSVNRGQLRIEVRELAQAQMEIAA